MFARSLAPDYQCWSAVQSHVRFVKGPWLLLPWEKVRRTCDSAAERTQYVTDFWSSKMSSAAAGKLSPLKVVLGLLALLMVSAGGIAVGFWLRGGGMPAAPAAQQVPGLHLV